MRALAAGMAIATACLSAHALDPSPRHNELALKREALRAPVEEASRTRDSQPQRYIDAMRQYLDAAPRLAVEYADLDSARWVKEEVGFAWLELGNFQRFGQRKTREALDSYAKAEQAGNPFAIFLQADTWQFDLRDKKRALSHYRRNLEELERMPIGGEPDDRHLVEWAKRWLRHQIAFLETGRTFSGAVGPVDITGLAVFVYIGSMPAFDDGVSLRKSTNKAAGLAALPASGWVFIRTASELAAMPDARSVLSFLSRNDPAGYASAGFFGLVEMVERASASGPRGEKSGFADSAALREAKRQFLRSRRITLQP